MKRLHPIFHFGYQQALSCIFPGFVFGILAISKVVQLPYLFRYDLILLCCIVVQILMVVSGLETKDELKVICVFHVLGFVLEVYKVHMGSWSYPESAWTKIWGVPLYSGFMYASVASYLCQAWRRLKVEIFKWPSTPKTVALGSIIYLNFFTHHFLFDFRWLIFITLFTLFDITYVRYEVNGKKYRMPLVLTFLLIGFFIWIAENIATFFGAWKYPNQEHVWRMVDLSKISSWFLLVIVSFIIVAHLKHVKQGKREDSST